MPILASFKIRKYVTQTFPYMFLLLAPKEKALYFVFGFVQFENAEPSNSKKKLSGFCSVCDFFRIICAVVDHCPVGTVVWVFSQNAFAL